MLSIFNGSYNIRQKWDKNGISPESVRSGKVAYTVLRFAKDIKPYLEQDMMRLKSMNRDKSMVREAMTDIYLLLANAPKIKQDIRSASVHYNISEDSIKFYLENYEYESEVLSTIIDVEYEKLVYKIGADSSHTISKSLESLIDQGLEVICD